MLDVEGGARQEVTCRACTSSRSKMLVLRPVAFTQLNVHIGAQAADSPSTGSAAAMHMAPQGHRRLQRVHNVYFLY